MQRISIVGSPGAGKTTFSRLLGKVLGIEVVELDRLFGHLDRMPFPRPECEARLAEVLACKSYILDGGFSWTYPQRIAACDTLIWLELGISRHFVNVLRRSLSANGPVAGDDARRRPIMKRLPNAPFWSGFLHEHIVGIEHIRAAFANQPDRVKLVRLHSHEEAGAYLETLVK